MKRWMVIAAVMYLSSTAHIAMEIEITDARLSDEMESRLASETGCDCKCLDQVQSLLEARVVLRERTPSLKSLGTLRKDIDHERAKQHCEVLGSGGGGVGGAFGRAYYSESVDDTKLLYKTGGATGNPGTTHHGRPDVINEVDFVKAVNLLDTKSQQTFIDALPTTLQDVFKKPEAMRSSKDLYSTKTTSLNQSQFTEELSSQDISLFKIGHGGSLAVDENPPILAALAKLDPNSRQRLVDNLPCSARAWYQDWIDDHANQTRQLFKGAVPFKWPQ